MDVLHDRCAALDIGKKDLKACVRRPSPTGRSRRQEISTCQAELRPVVQSKSPFAVGRESGIYLHV